MLESKNWTVEMLEKFIDQKLTLICKIKDNSTNILLYKSQKEKKTENKKENHIKSLLNIIVTFF
jgi:hypothetical protein